MAPVSGRVCESNRGRGTAGRQLLASSSLRYDTLDGYEPDHLLLDQARREVLESQLEIGRLRAVLERARDQALVLTAPERFTPLAFPLWVERLRNRLSTESWRDRVARMTERLEKHADRRAGDA